MPKPGCLLSLSARPERAVFMAVPKAATFIAWHISRGLTFEVTRDRRRDARPARRMIGQGASPAWWPAVGPRVDRGVRPRGVGDAAAGPTATEPNTLAGDERYDCSKPNDAEAHHAEIGGPAGARVLYKGSGRHRRISRTPKDVSASVVRRLPDHQPYEGARDPCLLQRCRSEAI